SLPPSRTTSNLLSGFFACASPTATPPCPLQALHKASIAASPARETKISLATNQRAIIRFLRGWARALRLLQSSSSLFSMLFPPPFSYSEIRSEEHTSELQSR